MMLAETPVRVLKLETVWAMALTVVPAVKVKISVPSWPRTSTVTLLPVWIAVEKPEADRPLPPPWLI
jgi:hypothetical protein